MMSQVSAPIVEIFRSLEGEGAFIGTPTIFVRLAGCNVGCKHCDSRQTWKESKYPKMAPKAVAEKVAELRNDCSFVPRVSITGGEPLLHLDFVTQLCDALMLTSNYHALNLETSGTLFPSIIFNAGNYADYFDQISMDIKTPSSGVKLNQFQIDMLRIACQESNVYTKAVIATQKDLHFTINLLSGIKPNNLVLTPCEISGKFFDIEKIQKVLDIHKINLAAFPLRIIAQQHKFLDIR